MKKQEKEKSPFSFSAVELAWDLGFTVALPLVLFILLGRFVDNRFDTSPLFLIIGIVLSVVISSWGIYRAVTKIIKKYDNNGGDEKKEK